jgi:hypothetical protein
MSLSVYNIKRGVYAADDEPREGRSQNGPTAEEKA